MEPTRVLIDFATGENWELPLPLYEKYQSACIQLKSTEISRRGITVIEDWLTTLTLEERSQVTKK